ncbi:hypothetical protein [Promicromonospora sp. NPDC050249]|uniref:hypothetical protein n=1 Tax=Promicromonospora sp. NPDC050249 TaxID=3154743 RepID=UPI0033E43C3D
MKRSLIAGATAVGLVFAGFVTPTAVAASTEVPPPSAAECDGSAESEAVALALASACGDDVEVVGAAGAGAEVFAEPNGGMRLEATANDSSVERPALAWTALREGGPSSYNWTGTQWVGHCDPAEYAEGCAVPGLQRLVWQFDGIKYLADLEPQDITSAELFAYGDDAWLDDVNCTPNHLELYDVPRISAGTTWASTSDWTADRRVGDIRFYWPECGLTPGYTGFFDFDATQLAINAARDNRSTVTAGLRAADETCMSCGWNSFKPRAQLVVRFNRVPATPTDLRVGYQSSSWSCAQETVVRVTTPRLMAHIVDPDPNSNDPQNPSGAPVTATFRITRAESPDVTVWEDSESSARSGEHYVDVPSETLTSGRYVWSVFGTDSSGLVSPTATCTFSIDIQAPAAPAVTPLVGGDAFYLENTERGAVGELGSFLVKSSSDDVVKYRYGLSSDRQLQEVAATENTVINVTPTRWGSNYLTVEALDAAGNRSLTTNYSIYVGGGGVTPTPPAITVAGPTSYTFGDVPTASVTLSEDAVTPYGKVTVKSGSTVVGSAVFDERTEQLQLDGPALGAGTKTLTFTYQSYPGAPEWSTQRTMTVRPLTFVTSRPASIDGIAQVGRTLTAQRWPWTPTPTTVTYQWRLNGAAVAGATSRTWTVPASAAGKKVSVTITGSANGYATLSVRSPATAAVKVGTFSAPRPTISGTRQVGYTLQAVRGTWSPLPTTVRYQWKVGGVAVPGATYYRFRVPASARGKQVTVVVTGSRAGYANKTVYSPLSGTIR